MLDDQIAAYDAMRRRCPVAHSDYLHWSLFRHEDVLRVLLDHDTFGSAVSRHLSVPNGMDPPAHTPYRRMIESYFSPERMGAFEPACRAISTELVARLPQGGETELNAALAQPFSLQIQCAFLGWPARLHEPLRLWTLKNQAATLSRDRAALDDVALEFDGYIKGLLDERRAAGDGAPDDLTTRLLRDRAGDNPLSDEEIVSILRNWTVGELGTISACVGILAHYLAAQPDIQRRLRADWSLLPAAIDEILRMHAPLIANRRITRKPVHIGGKQLGVGERITLMWASANRDEAVFGDPDAFRLDRDPADNLLYGLGIHVCPGAPLARMELRVVMEALLKQTRWLALVADKAPVRAVYPASGYATLPLRID